MLIKCIQIYTLSQRCLPLCVAYSVTKLEYPKAGHQKLPPDHCGCTFVFIRLRRRLLLLWLLQPKWLLSSSTSSSSSTCAGQRLSWFSFSLFCPSLHLSQSVQLLPKAFAFAAPHLTLIVNDQFRLSAYY